MTSPSDDTLAGAARSFYTPLQTGDTASLDAILAADWQAVPPLRTGPGAAGWKASVEHLRGVFSDMEVTIEDVLVAGDRVAVRTTTRGTHVGDLLGVPGTGRRIEFRSCDVHRFDGDRIVESWHLEDYFSIATQLGLAFSLPEGR